MQAAEYFQDSDMVERLCSILGTRLVEHVAGDNSSAQVGQARSQQKDLAVKVRVIPFSWVTNSIHGTL